MDAVRDYLGICQWFHYQAYDDLERAVAIMRELGIRHLRTGVSWADFHRPDGQDWCDHQFRMLADFDILLSVWHTPPSIAEGACCNSPPRRLDDYADFIVQLIDRYGDAIDCLELWNEPNNRYKWDFQRFDPAWQKFGAMVGRAGAAARSRGMPTVLGGMIPVDPSWLGLMRDYGVLEHCDAIGIHAFPGMWWEGAPCWDQADRWHGWQHKIDSIVEHAGGLPIWVTETGLATWDLPNAHHGRYHRQCLHLRRAALAPVQRCYWYSLVDLDPCREAIEGFHVDENEYHLGVVDHHGECKPAFDTLAELLGQTVAEARAESQRLRVG